MPGRGTGPGGRQAGTHVGRGQHSRTPELLRSAVSAPIRGAPAQEADPDLALLELGLRWNLLWGLWALGLSTGRTAEGPCGLSGFCRL